MEILESLHVLGLSEKEAKVYTALLQLGESSAYVIAEKGGLKKPTTYVVLDELIKKGLARKIPRRRKQLYIAKSPEEVFALAEERLSLAKEALPKIKALTKGERTKVNVMYFEGANGIKQMLEHRVKEMKGKEMVGFYATDPDPEKSGLSDYFQNEWNEKMLRLGVTMRGIVPEHPSLESYRETDTKYKREIKTVSYEEYSSDIALDVIGDTVRIQDYKNLQGVLLENPDVAKTIREIFEMVWKKT